MHISIAIPKLVVTKHSNSAPENQQLNLVEQMTQISNQSNVYTHKKYDIRGPNIENIFQPVKDYKSSLRLE